MAFLIGCFGLLLQADIDSHFIGGRCFVVKSPSCLVKDLRVEVTRLCSAREDEQEEINRLMGETLQGQDTRSCILQKKGQPG